jgi:hypothetical protein
LLGRTDRTIGVVGDDLVDKIFQVFHGSLLADRSTNIRGCRTGS